MDGDEKVKREFATMRLIKENLLGQNTSLSRD